MKRLKLIRGGIYLLPRMFTFENYKYVLSEDSIFNATLISALRTIIGTVTTVFCSAIVAYAISRQDFVLRKFVTIAFILTMYINGGLMLHRYQSLWYIHSYKSISLKGCWSEE